MNDPSIPKIKAIINYPQYADGIIILKFYCKYCDCWHLYGGGDNPNNILYGHRTPHCHVKTSLYLHENGDNGYELVKEEN